jgi:hypothetical protein
LRNYSFYQRQIHYLGHIISEKGVVLDPTKKKSIEECPTPRNAIEMRSFMGLERYYKWFIEGLL